MAGRGSVTLCLRLDAAASADGREIKLPEGIVRLEMEKAAV